VMRLLKGAITNAIAIVIKTPTPLHLTRGQIQSDR
jgi:hypothetical protein